MTRIEKTAARQSFSDGRAHGARTPSEIPGPGWWSILKRVYAASNDKNVSTLAAGVGFFAILAVFPAIAALVAVYGLVSNPANVQHQIAALKGVMPAEAQNLLAAYMKSLANSSGSKLGIGLLVSVLFALWSARAGTVSLMLSLNTTYDEQEKRGTIRFQLVALLLTAAAIVFATLALALIAALPAALAFLPMAAAARSVELALRWPALVVMVASGLAVLYRFAPSRREAKWRWVSWGGVAATMLWLGASIGFSYYVREFGSYDRTFGSLGAVVVLMTWLYISAYAVLLGAVLNAEMERQTAPDTTGDPEKPLGHRGATVADNVAQD